MGDGLIFDVHSFDRSSVQWEHYLDRITPVEERGGISFKREDYFAPLGHGGINGSKLRQCIYLVWRYGHGSAGVLSAASVLSPQHAMVASVARHFGLPSVHVLGATTYEAARKHDSVAIAEAAGAQFDFIGAGWNPALKQRVRELHSTSCRGFYKLEYAISLGHLGTPVDEVREFQELGARQVVNLPHDMSRLLISAGSCNSAASVLWGLARSKRRPVPLHLIGIGHSCVYPWLAERLQVLGVKFSSAGGRPWGWELDDTSGRAWPVYYHDLVAMKYTTYQKWVPRSLEGVAGHPTYEGKCFAWLQDKRPDLLDGHPCFWVIGGEPKADVMRRYLGESASIQEEQSQ